MKPKQPIRAVECAQSIRAGTNDKELMDKYGISRHQLGKLFQKLLDAQVISQDELYANSELYRTRIDDFRERSAPPRVELDVPLKVYEVPSAHGGLVRDLSETGLRVAGLQSVVGEEKIFQMPLDTFFGLDPLQFTARCIWAKTRGKQMQYRVAGYAIEDISAAHREVLKKLIGMLLLTRSGEWSILE